MMNGSLQKGRKREKRRIVDCPIPMVWAEVPIIDAEKDVEHNKKLRKYRKGAGSLQKEIPPHASSGS